MERAAGQGCGGRGREIERERESEGEEGALCLLSGDYIVHQAAGRPASAPRIDV